MEAAFSAYGGDSDSESIRSDISETLSGGFQRRPGSGRRKARPVRSPFDGYASNSTESQSCCAQKEYVPSRLGVPSHVLEGCSPSLQATSSPRSPASVAAGGASSAAANANSSAVTSSTPSKTTSGAASTRRKTKQDLTGPCCHCGAIQSPQWRKGPKGKPILCNACGIRFLRTRSLGKAMPKKRRVAAPVAAPAAAPAAPAAAAAGSAPVGLSELGIISSKRFRTLDPSTEDDEAETMATEDGMATEAMMLDETHSGHLSISSSHLSSGTANLPGSPAHPNSAAATSNTPTHPGQHQHHQLLGSFQHHHLPAVFAAARSRLAIASNAAAAAAAAAAATAAAAGPAPAGSRATGGGGGGVEFCGLEAEGGSSDLATLQQPDQGPSALLLAAAATAPHNSNNSATGSQTATAAPRANNNSPAAAPNTANTSFGGTFIGLLGPGSSGIQQPLPAGSRHILLGRGTGLGGLISSNPSLALAIAMHQHHSSQLQGQQQPNSPAKIGVSASMAATGSPMSTVSSGYNLRFEHSMEQSAASASPPTSPLLLGGSQQAVTSARSSGATIGAGSSSGGGSAMDHHTQLQLQQQQQGGMRGPSPLSLMGSSSATTAELISAASGCVQAPGTAAPATAASAGGGDMLQLVNHMAGVLGGMGPAFQFLKAINGNAAAVAAASAAAAGTAGKPAAAAAAQSAAGTKMEQ